MAESVLVAGLGVVAFILVLLFFKLGESEDKKHFLLQVLFLGFIVGIFVLIGKASLDAEDYCEYLTNYTNVSGNITTYTPGYFCTENNNDTAESFYEVTIWIFRIVMVYIFLYFAFEAFNFFYNWSRGEGR